MSISFAILFILVASIYNKLRNYISEKFLSQTILLPLTYVLILEASIINTCA